MDFITLLSQLQFHFVAVWHSKHAWLISVIHTVNTMQVFHSFIKTNFATLLSNGRPYGGCAASLSSSISHCQIVSRRFCGIKVKLAGGHIYLVVCVYLPFDDGHASDALKFGEVLGELRLFCTLSIMTCWLWLEILMVTLLVLIVLELVNCSVPCRLLV